MYFLRVAPLRQQLAREGLSESDRFRYLLGSAVLALVAGLGGFVTIMGGGHWAFPVTNLVLILYAYWRNGGARGRDFLDRFVSVYFVVMLKISLPLLGLFALASMSTVVAALTLPLDNWLTTLQAMAQTDNVDLDQVEHAGLVLVAIPFVVYATFAVGYHLGKIRQLAGGDGAISPAPAPAQAVPATAGSARRLDRFVETVIQREPAAAPPSAVRAGQGLTLHKRPARPRSGLVLRRAASRSAPRSKH